MLNLCLQTFCNQSWNYKEEFEDTKGEIRIRKSQKETTQWSNEKGQKDKQCSTKHTHKIKYRVIRTPLKNGG